MTHDYESEKYDTREEETRTLLRMISSALGVYRESSKERPNHVRKETLRGDDTPIMHRGV